MNTGMTRAYRRDVIRSLPLERDRKEFHVEVILKARALGYRIAEIPCTLEWLDYKLESFGRRREHSSGLGRSVLSHYLFSLFARPIRYVWTLSALIGVASLGFLVWAAVRLSMGLVSVYVAIMSLAMAGLALLFFTFGVLAQQGAIIQRELWTLRRDLRAAIPGGASPPAPGRQERRATAEKPKIGN